MPKKKVSFFGEAYGKIFSLYKDNFLLFFLLSLSIGICELSSTFLGNKESSIMLIPLGLQYILEVLVTIVIFEIVEKLQKKRKLNINEMVISSFKYFWVVLFVSVVYIMISFGWGMILIIPGIIASSRFIAASVIAVTENESFLNSFKKSYYLTKDFITEIFTIGVLPGLFYIILYFMFNVGLKINYVTDTIWIFIRPITVLIPPVIYNMLLKRNRKNYKKWQKFATWIMIAVICIGIILCILRIPKLLYDLNVLGVK